MARKPYVKQYDHRKLDRAREAELAAPYSFDDVARALLRAEYRFAKTMPHIPHWYTLAKNWNDPVVPFENVVAYIRVHGYESDYKGAHRHYFNLNGMQYWSMGWPTEETELINRAVPSVTKFRAAYDSIADNYDGLYASEEARAEEWDVFEPLCDKQIPALLDIGCGTGLTLDYITPDRYVGIDPSHQMLDKVVPLRGTLEPNDELIRAALHEFWTEEKFDVVLSLFGVTNYLTEDQVRRIPTFCKPGGTYHVMLFRDDYEPRTRALGDDLPIYRHPVDILPGKVDPVGENYIVIRGTA